MDELKKEMDEIGYITITVSHGPYEHGAGYPDNGWEEEQQVRPHRYLTLASEYDRLGQRLHELQLKLDRTAAK